MGTKSKKSEMTLSINPMQDDLEKIGVGAAALERMGAPVKAVKEALKKGVQVVKKGKKKIGEKIYKAVGEESKFSKALMDKPKRTATAMVVGVGAAKKKKWDEGGYDKDMSSTEGSFSKGGLVRSGKPKLAKKGWR